MKAGRAGLLRTTIGEGEWNAGGRAIEGRLKNGRRRRRMGVSQRQVDDVFDEGQE